MTLTPGHILSNNYRVERLIAQGGMGAVYQATQLSLGTPVALKVLAPTYAADPDFQQRFAREARIIAGLRHPHIVSVIDFAAEAAGPYLVMELVRGGSLVTLPQQFQQRHGQPLPVLFAVELVRQAAEALAYAHAEDVIHRDIKPGNLLVEQVRGAGGSPTYLLKVADFGLARLVGPRAAGQPLTSRVFCTPEYAAPEQLQLLPLDGKCDVFALGVVLYELLTGGLPGAGVAAVGGIAGPRSLRPTVSAALDRLVLACLERDPARRPSADELATALVALRAAPTVAPAPAPSGAQTRTAPDVPAPPPTIAHPGAGQPLPTPPPLPTPAPATWPRLRVHESGNVRSFEITAVPLTVGRDPNNSVQLNDDAVSREHLEIHCKGGVVFVTDRRSRNGSLLDGRPLLPDTPTVWPWGARVRIGETWLTLVQPTAPVNLPPPTPVPPRAAQSTPPEAAQMVGRFGQVRAAESVEQLRQAHAVRALYSVETKSDLRALPHGVYGYAHVSDLAKVREQADGDAGWIRLTASPRSGLLGAAGKRIELHKTGDGLCRVVGFGSVETVTTLCQSVPGAHTTCELALEPAPPAFARPIAITLPAIFAWKWLGKRQGSEVIQLTLV